MDSIDKILYINLEHRVDRKVGILAEFEKVGAPLEKVARIDAVRKPENGAYGCILSHIVALETFLADPTLQTALILEDDFRFHGAGTAIAGRLAILGDTEFVWDVLSFAYNPRGADLKPTGRPGIVKVHKHGTTSGYLVHRRFANTLLANYKECATLMETHGKHHFSCLDVHWIRLQAPNAWYALSPALGFQEDGYSDIERSHVSYNC
jgi:GR25 family glycosyltransferase involved in LPS biosynthesis